MPLIINSHGKAQYFTHLLLKLHQSLIYYDHQMSKIDERINQFDLDKSSIETLDRLGEAYDDVKRKDVP